MHMYPVACRRLQEERDQLAENKNKITADLERLLNQREVTHDALDFCNLYAG